MLKKSPYDIIKGRHVTEKARVMEQLQFNSSNPCVKKCDSPKFVFIVAKAANKYEIAKAVEEIYADKGVRVVAVNTSNVGPKERRVRGRKGFKAGYKKAVVTFEAGDSIDDKI